LEKFRQSFWQIERESRAFFQKTGEKRGIWGDDFGISQNRDGICGRFYRKFLDFIILQLILRP